jgi:hypothetical protein
LQGSQIRAQRSPRRPFSRLERAPARACARETRPAISTAGCGKCGAGRGFLFPPRRVERRAGGRSRLRNGSKKAPFRSLRAPTPLSRREGALGADLALRAPSPVSAGSAIKLPMGSLKCPRERGSGGPQEQSSGTRHQRCGPHTRTAPPQFPVPQCAPVHARAHEPSPLLPHVADTARIPDRACRRGSNPR